MEQTWKPTTAGILSIIAGALQVIIGMGLAIAGGIAGIFTGIPWFGVAGIPLTVIGVVAIVGGAYALKRRVWGLALAGAICALFGPWGILGILAIIFVALGKAEFE
jgi:hypothetical protein